jgi:hypothetical protein
VCEKEQEDFCLRAHRTTFRTASSLKRHWTTEPWPCCVVVVEGFFFLSYFIFCVHTHPLVTIQSSFFFFLSFHFGRTKKRQKMAFKHVVLVNVFLLGILCITFYILYRADTFFFGWDFYWHFGDDWRKFLRMSTWEEILILFSPWNSFWKIKRMSTRVCLLGMFSTTCTHDFSSFFSSF